MASDTIERGPDNTATVVFACDDPAVIGVMGDAAQRRREVWDVHVTQTGEATLALLKELPSVDVLVSSVCVPGISVGDVLAHARQRSPHTARIVLSSQSDRERVLGLLGAAHQYLSIPLDIGVLDELIEHVRCAVGSDLRDPVRALIGQVDRLPSPPAVFQRLSALMATDDWSITDIAGEITQDVGLTGEVLRLVNSSFFGTAERVTSVERAVVLVGIDLIRFAVLGSKLFQADNAIEIWLDLDRVDQRSRAVAHGMRALAIRERAAADAVAVAYLAGMVSEIGLLVMARIPDIAPSIAEPVNNASFPGAERAIFGGDRFEVGCQLLRLWGFDDDVIDAVGQLSTSAAPCSELAWRLHAARRLVVDQGFDPHDLASPVGSRLDVDEAIDRLHDELESSPVAAT